MLTNEWQKPTSCFGGLGCIEAKLDDSEVMIRDDKHPEKVIRTDQASWKAFLEAAKQGEFDLP